ncbi:MAG: hypothetical protein RQ715_02535 [Methylococcales bacterium]|nr:hypothetical protein [Methylococcales bacterium]
MGPYYRGTSQGVGALFDFMYQHPFLTLALATLVVSVGYYYWRKSQAQR